MHVCLWASDGIPFHNPSIFKLFGSISMILLYIRFQNVWTSVFLECQPNTMLMVLPSRLDKPLMPVTVRKMFDQWCFQKIKLNIIFFCKLPEDSLVSCPVKKILTNYLCRAIRHFGFQFTNGPPSCIVIFCIQFSLCFSRILNVLILIWIIF